MSPRLSKIVTRTGDDGTTGLGDGTRLPKGSARIEAIGAIDELNSALGVLLAQPLPGTASAPSRASPAPGAARHASAVAATASAPTGDWLLEVQQRLFDLGGELAVPGLAIVSDAHVQTLEQRIAQLNERLPPLQEFVLPGGGAAAAACHLARAICRRAERRCWALARAMAAAKAVAPKAAGPKSRTVRTAKRTGTAGASRAVSGTSLRYLNRLSDFLFVLARIYARAAGSSEPLWQHQRGSGRTRRRRRGQRGERGERGE